MRVPFGSLIVTWKTGAGASPVFATWMMKGTVARCCTGSRMIVLLLVATELITMLGRRGVGVSVGVSVTLGVTPGTFVFVGGPCVGVTGCANFVCVAKIAVEDISPADACCMPLVGIGVQVSVGSTTIGIVLLGVGG